ncbi:MAG: hypothetical protein PHW95_04980 [Patescibacteria group bacterium]|nr:hypothetical protein [Patescibacteria group bacterium]
MKEKLNYFWVPIIICILFYSIFLGLKLYQNNFDLSSFIILGDKFVNNEAPPDRVMVITDSYGYDGQFYYRLALNPFTQEKTAYGITLDQPALRHQRILYPLIIWLSALGNSQATPLIMIIVNIVSLFGLTGLAIKLTKDNNQPLWFSMIIPLYPAFLIALSRDLTEILSSFLLIFGYLFFTKNRYYFSVTLLTLAVLTRETTLIFPTIISLYFFILFIINKKRTELTRALIFFLPLAVYAIWQIILYKIWGQLPFLLSNSLNITYPLKGLGYIFYFKTFTAKLRILEVIYLLGVIILGAINFKKISDWPLKLTWLSYVILSCFYAKWIWSEDWTFFRAFTELYIFSFILVLKGNNYYVKKILFFSTIAMTGVILLKIFI